MEHVICFIFGENIFWEILSNRFVQLALCFSPCNLFSYFFKAGVLTGRRSTKLLAAAREILQMMMTHVHFEQILVSHFAAQQYKKPRFIDGMCWGHGQGGRGEEIKWAACPKLGPGRHPGFVDSLDPGRDWITKWGTGRFQAGETDFFFLNTI